MPRGRSLQGLFAMRFEAVGGALFSAAAVKAAAKAYFEKGHGYSFLCSVRYICAMIKNLGWFEYALWIV